MMNPLEFRLILIVAYLSLALFGIGYNKLIEISKLKGLVAFSVVVGNIVTIGVIAVSFHALIIPLWADTVLLFGGFACSGAPMIIGSRMRHAKEVQEETEARKNHRALRWPNDMKVMRDSSAEEAVSGMRMLNELQDDMRSDQREKVLRAKNSFLKIAALLMRAGAPIRIEDL